MSYVNLSKQTDVTGTDKYRSEDSAIPMAYRPVVAHTITPNALGTSHSVTIKVTAPSVLTVNGVTTSTDTFIGSAKFTALQRITDDVTRAKAYDDLIRFMIATRETNLRGELPRTTLPASWADLDIAALAAKLK